MKAIYHETHDTLRVVQRGTGFFVQQRTGEKGHWPSGTKMGPARSWRGSFVHKGPMDHPWQDISKKQETLDQAKLTMETRAFGRPIFGEAA